MKTLHSIRQRTSQISELSDRMIILSEEIRKAEPVKSFQPELSEVCSKRYYGAKSLMQLYNFSGIEKFDDCYYGRLYKANGKRSHFNAHTYIEEFCKKGLHEFIYTSSWCLKEQKDRDEKHSLFLSFLTQAKHLILSLEQEVMSKQLNIKTELSFDLVAEEIENAKTIFNEANETAIRVSGVICRIAIERHLLTIIDEKGLQLVINPPTKKKATSSDYISTLKKNTVINATIQKKLDYLFDIGNKCAHPKEIIDPELVKELIDETESICAKLF